MVQAMKAASQTQPLQESSWQCDFHGCSDDQNNPFHTTNSEVIESKYLKIESATSNKAVNQKPQYIVKRSISSTTTIYREESVTGRGLEGHETFQEELTFFSIYPQKGTEPHTKDQILLSLKHANPLQLSESL